MTTESKIDIVKGDITLMEVEAIVNAANNSLLGGGGVDGAIHKAAGPRLLEECKLLNGCNTGEAKITAGYNLPAKYVIHSVGPVWRGGNYNEDTLLSNCYKNSLKLALLKNITTLAFPSISTGVYGFPIKRASKLAMATVQNFLDKNESLKKIYFICFSNSDYDVYTNLLG